MLMNVLSGKRRGSLPLCSVDVTLSCPLLSRVLRWAFLGLTARASAEGACSRTQSVPSRSLTRAGRGGHRCWEPRSPLPAGQESLLGGTWGQTLPPTHRRGRRKSYLQSRERRSGSGEINPRAQGQRDGDLISWPACARVFESKLSLTSVMKAPSSPPPGSPSLSPTLQCFGALSKVLAMTSHLVL